MPCELPAELLIEILSPSLLVPDEMFADNGPYSPFDKVDQPASNVILVCKSWMYVATPLLYATVIMRSEAQAQALAFALTNNPDFGKFIRRLRVEGAYGDHVWTAIQNAPNVTDLCMTLAVWPDTSPAGLVQSLAHIDPHRVILTMAPIGPIRNITHRALLNALCSQIRSWTCLKTFTFAGDGVKFDLGLVIPDYIVFPTIVAALCTSPSLEEVQLTVIDTSEAVFDVINQLIGDDGRRIVQLCRSGDVTDSQFEIQVEQLRGQCPAQLRPHILTVGPSADLDKSSQF